MGETLYRKYRPQRFADIHEQEHVKTVLQNEIKSGAVAHAYVFSGSRGVGKTSMARIFAKALNCAKRAEGSAEPCNTCKNCEEIAAGRSLDVFEVDAASQSGVDNVRERIIEAVRFPPTSGKYKIFIIDEAHMLSTAAWNALLKTLEEPPAHAVFILASTELQKFPETILSRCQRFEFKKLKPAEVLQKLKRIADEEKVLIDEDILRAVVRRSEGGMRDAESLLGQLFALGTTITKEQAAVFLPTTATKSLVDFLKVLAEMNAAEGLRLIAKLTENGTDLPQFCADLVATARLMLVAVVTADRALMNDAYDSLTAEELFKIGTTLGAPRLLVTLDVLIKAHHETKYAEIPTLPLEMAVVELCAAQTAKPPAAVIPASEPGSRKASMIPDQVRDDRQVREDKPAVSKQELKVEEAPARPSMLTKTLDELRAKWSEVITKVSEVSQSLPFILKLSQPVAIRGNELHLAFQYPFHADTFNKDTNRRLVEDAFQSVCGETPRCLGITAERKAGEPAPSELMPVVDAKMKSVLDEFGGKLVG